MKTIYKVTFPNNKIYVGSDMTDTINYTGSPNSKLIAEDFTREERQRFVIVKEILYESETATDSEIKIKTTAFIKELKSNDPTVGYNRSKF